MEENIIMAVKIAISLVAIAACVISFKASDSKRRRLADVVWMIGVAGLTILLTW